MVILFPSDYFNKKKPDELFSEQVTAFRNLGFSIATISLEDLASGNATIYPTLNDQETILYRGWMLTTQDYTQLISTIKQANCTAHTPLEPYLLTHHIPNWYPLISDLTAETVCFTDLDKAEERLKELDWQGFFVKDFVKSLKTSLGSRISSAEEIHKVITEMKKFRGQLEGGLCVRRIEVLNDASEQRYFVINRTVHSSTQELIPQLVLECASRVNSPFFSIDTALRHDGVLRIVELGDGQVSDIVGWSAERFASLWLSEKNAVLPT